MVSHKNGTFIVQKLEDSENRKMSKDLTIQERKLFISLIETYVGAFISTNSEIRPTEVQIQIINTGNKWASDAHASKKDGTLGLCNDF